MDLTPALPLLEMGRLGTQIRDFLPVDVPLAQWIENTLSSAPFRNAENEMSWKKHQRLGDSHTVRSPR